MIYYVIIKLLFIRIKVIYFKFLNRGFFLKIIWVIFEEDYIWFKYYDC